MEGLILSRITIHTVKFNKKNILNNRSQKHIIPFLVSLPSDEVVSTSS
jgi:hypothetical protein